MKLRYGAILLLGAGIGLAIPTAAAEKKIERSALPADVKRTVDVETRGASIRGFSQETEGGNTYYEVEMIADGQHKDVLIDSKGAVVEIEQEVSTDSLPAAVRTGLETKAEGGTIQKVESLTKHGKLVAYEAQVLTNGKKSEIQVGPNGKPLVQPD